MGAWIEILQTYYEGTGKLSLPTWERGLKLLQRRGNNAVIKVAPYMGAWIEMERVSKMQLDFEVAPYMGA